jgi:hypothetical protein
VQIRKLRSRSVMVETLCVAALKLDTKACDKMSNWYRYRQRYLLMTFRIWIYLLTFFWWKISLISNIYFACWLPPNRARVSWPPSFKLEFFSYERILDGNLLFFSSFSVGQNVNTIFLTHKSTNMRAHSRSEVQFIESMHMRCATNFLKFLIRFMSRWK